MADIATFNISSGAPVASPQPNLVQPGSLVELFKQPEMMGVLQEVFGNIFVQMKMSPPAPGGISQPGSPLRAQGPDDAATVARKTATKLRQDDYEALCKHAAGSAVRSSFAYRFANAYQTYWYTVNFTDVINPASNEAPKELTAAIDDTRREFETLDPSVVPLITIPACIAIVKKETHNQSNRDRTARKRKGADDESSTSGSSRCNKQRTSAISDGDVHGPSRQGDEQSTVTGDIGQAANQLDNGGGANDGQSASGGQPASGGGQSASDGGGHRWTASQLWPASRER
eukprot:m.77657 g.77657  ORF g.77657 m.77657 type:complete len:287 (-) comp7922_c0_seq4:155-1015(-)